MSLVLMAKWQVLRHSFALSLANVVMQIFYGILDILAKPVFCAYHVFSMRNLPYEMFQLQSGKASLAAGAGSATYGGGNKLGGVGGATHANHGLGTNGVNGTGVNGANAGVTGTHTTGVNTANNTNMASRI